MDKTRRKSLLQAQRTLLLQSLDVCIFASFLQIWFIDHATLQAFARTISQIQFSNPHLIHPNRNLAFFATFLALLNSTFFLAHCFVTLPVSGAGHRRSSSGLFLDFVGQDHIPSRAYILLLDLLGALLQLIYLVISYDQSPRIETLSSTTADGAGDSSSDESESDEPKSFYGSSAPDSEDSDPYSTPIITLSFHSTLRRILHASTAETEADPATLANEESSLTARGRRRRARRRRRGLQADRIQEAALEEAALGR